MASYPRPNTRRSPTTLRPLSAELSSLSRSDGSASLQVGNTHVLCAVHGPMAPRVSRWERYDSGVVSVAFSRGLMAHSTNNTGSAANGVDGSSGNDTSVDANVVGGENVKDQQQHPSSSSSSIMKSVPVPPPPGLGATERELEYYLRDALSSCILLDQYPRCVIQVVIQIVQADGCVLGSAVNCAVLALMDAGVAMGGLPVASTCVVVPEYHNLGNPDGMMVDAEKEEKGEAIIWLDPTAEEEAGEGHAIVVLVTDMAASSSTAATIPEKSSSESSEMGIITSYTFGAPLSLKGLLSSVENSKQSSAAMVAFMRLAVEQKVQREVQTLWS